MFSTVYDHDITSLYMKVLRTFHIIGLAKGKYDITKSFTK